MPHHAPVRTDDLYQLPADLPVPVDDGAARHLIGATLPPVALPSTSGGSVRLDDAAGSLVVVYCYPRTGRPDAVALGSTADWNAIPGARGCKIGRASCRERVVRAGGALAGTKKE